MAERVTPLQATPLPKQGPVAQSLRLPGELICPDGMIFHALEAKVQRHLLLQTVPSLRERAERFLVIQGEPGTSKTVTACDASLRYGWAVSPLPMAGLAGENEGSATEILKQYLEDAVSLSLAKMLRIVFVADDGDLSILSSDAKTGNTVNTNLLTNAFQVLADLPKRYRLFDGSVIPIIFTGNDYSKVRPSLLRSSRATVYTHKLTLEERVRLAFHLLAPKSSEELHLVEKLVRAYRNENASFWSALKTDIHAARLDQVIAQGITDPDVIEKHLARPLVLDPDTVWAFAKARATNRPRSFL